MTSEQKDRVYVQGLKVGESAHRDGAEAPTGAVQTEMRGEVAPRLVRALNQREARLPGWQC